MHGKHIEQKSDLIRGDGFIIFNACLKLLSRTNVDSTYYTSLTSRSDH